MGGVDYARSLWVRDGYGVNRGSLHGPNGFEADLAEHLHLADFDDVELVRIEG